MTNPALLFGQGGMFPEAERLAVALDKPADMPSRAEGALLHALLESVLLRRAIFMGWRELRTDARRLMDTPGVL